jgi:hypothetical protein
VVVVYGDLGGAGVIPVFGWASWPVKEIVARPVFQADPIEGIGGPEESGAQQRFSFRGRHRMTHKRGSCQGAAICGQLLFQNKDHLAHVTNFVSVGSGLSLLGYTQ